MKMSVQWGHPTSTSKPEWESIRKIRKQETRNRKTGKLKDLNGKTEH